MDDNIRAAIRALTEALPPGALSNRPADLEAHAVDRWPAGLKRQQTGVPASLPAAVIWPESVNDVVSIVNIANAYAIPLTAWGGGTSVVGQPIPEPFGLSVDLTRMNRVLDVDVYDRLVRVEAGAIGAEVERALQAVGYTMHMSPQSISQSTIGGWVSTRASGHFSSRWGSIEDSVIALSAVLPSGSIYESRSVPRAATGPDIKQLFIGAEGTLGIIVTVTLKIYPVPEAQQFETLRFGSVSHGLAAMREILGQDLRPFLLRLYDSYEARSVFHGEAATGTTMLVGTEGRRSIANAELQEVVSVCVAHGAKPLGPQMARSWMERRFDFSAIQAVLERPGGFAETIEVANTWSKIEATYAEMRAGLSGIADEVRCHFSHAYTTGTSLYVIVLGDSSSPGVALQHLDEIWTRAMTAALTTDAAISHHHGVGLARLPWIREELGQQAFEVLDHVKAAMDPNGIFAPGRLGLSRGS